jgi:CDP-diacylglycerol--glycerol-3-phosphate 3-phosphatidyltransferase
MLKDIPNWLTMSRIILIPFVLVAMYFESSVFGHRFAAALFLYACITDFFDGYLARIWNVQSMIGRFLDPIADKLLVASVMVMLVYYGRADLFPAIAIIAREILVSGLREFLAEIKVSMPVSELGKYKTFVQMSAIFVLILGKEGSGIEYTDILGSTILWIAAGLTLLSGYIYFKASYKYLLGKNDNNG